MPASRLAADLDRLTSEFAGDGAPTATAFRDLRLTIARINELRRRLDAAQRKLAPVLSLAESKAVARQVAPEAAAQPADHFAVPEDGPTGIAPIDEAHRAIFRAGNQVYAAAFQRHAAATIDAAVSRLIEAARTAFDLEEQLMAGAGYPRLEAHRGIHGRMLNHLQEMRQLIADEPLAVVVLLEQLLGSWFLLHRQREDADLGRHCRPGAADAELSDPVCGAEITDAAQHRCAHAGVVFHFCSEACRSRFVADPSHYADVRFFACDDPMAPQPPEAADIARRPPRPAHDRLAEATSAEAAGSLGGAISSWLLARRERRYAANTSREMSALYQSLAAEHPGLPDREILVHTLMFHLGSSEAEAARILQRAEESFAEWPVPREVTLCDVVHYLSVTEFVDEHPGEHWLHAEVQEVIASQIPHRLCVTRKRGGR